MGLLHWWPLNGTNGEKDLGLAKQDLSSRTWVDGGKLGKCCKSTSLSFTESELVEKTVFSCSIWWKVSSTECTTHYSNIICFDIYDPTKGGSGAIRYDNEMYSTQTARAMHFHDNSTSGNFLTSLTFNNAINDPYDTWHHYVMACDGTNIYFYSDGQQIGSGTVKSGSYLKGTIWASNITGVYVNDLRIYNHCLSKKEVKELSKALVLHYDFEDAALSKNLISNIGIAEQELNTKANYRVVAESTTNFGLSAGDTYCWSVYVRVPTDQKKLKARVQFYNSGSDRTGPSGSTMVTNGEGLVYVSGTVLNGYSSMQLLIDFNSSVDITTTNIPCYYKMGKLEKGRTTPTAWTDSTEPTKIYDCSGYNNNGTQPYNAVQLSTASISGSNSAYFDGGAKIQTNYSTVGLTTLTYTAWVYPTARHSERSCICIGGTYFTITSGGKLSGYAYGKSPAGYHTGTATIPLNAWTHVAIVWDSSYIYGYVNGVQDFKIACTGTFNGGTAQQIGIENTSGRAYTGYIADFKIYTTALSADDIALEYNRKAAIDKSGNLFTGEIIEHYITENLLELAAFNIETQVSFDGHLGAIKKTSYDASYPNANSAGIGKYEQTNLKVTMTDDGVRIYSAPNLTTSANGSTMWGGLCISPMKHANCLVKGHRYRLSFHVSGQSSRDMSDIYFSSQVGWGNVCAPSPSDVKIVRHGTNFQGEKDCYYEFTINDDIWKVCPDTNVSGASSYNSAFVAGETYLSYAAIKLGYTYASTGELGTDIYISNIKLHDITDNKVYKINKNNTIKTTEIITGRRNSTRINSDGVISVNNVIEL